MIGPARGSHNGLVEAAKRTAAVVIAEQVKLVAKGADDLVSAVWVVAVGCRSEPGGQVRD